MATVFAAYNNSKSGSTLLEVSSFFVCSPLWLCDGSFPPTTPSPSPAHLSPFWQLLFDLHRRKSRGGLSRRSLFPISIPAPAIVTRHLTSDPIGGVQRVPLEIV